VISFKLTPFPGERAPGASIAGDVQRDTGRLVATYRITMRPGALVIPAAADAPTRRDELWRSTCVEMFVGVPGKTGYIEVNLSPSRDWNVYRFDDYRFAMTQIDVARFEAHASSVEFSMMLGFVMVLPPDLGTAPMLEAGVSAVLQHSDGATTHWALAHRGSRPDFHRRDGFMLSI